MARSSGKKKNTSKKSRTWRGKLWRGVFYLAFIGGGAGLILFAFIDWQVQRKFENHQWAIPAQVYARPLELYEGLPINIAQLEQELKALNYRFGRLPEKPGEAEMRGKWITVYSRGFTFADGVEPAKMLRFGLSEGRVVNLQERTPSGDWQPLGIYRLEPQQIGGIYPAHGEDRILVKLEDIPVALGTALIAVEDKDFNEHFGLSPKAILRAALANLKAGSIVQGGSTLTQQLVKNLYLSQERNLWRKVQEALMTLSLELHYSKAKILETYINEVYLGQSGPRAIHGFALAANYYFGRSLQQLDTHEIALLVGMVKGASYYNPWRHPKRAKARRDLVLDIMQDAGLLTNSEGTRYRAKPLGIQDREDVSQYAYPAFIDLIQRQLREDYREEDLSSEGLQVYTTLAPSVQWAAEQSLSTTLNKLESGYRLQKDGLQGALVVTDTSGGEVLALVGDRNPRYAGFNRALDARRQAGSLFKPAVYLAALQTGRYNLASMLDDGPVSVGMAGESVWEPQNFDHLTHANVLFYQGLAHSYNQATAHLGLEVGIGEVTDTLRAMGLNDDVPQLPSVFLGAKSVSPLQISQIYHTLATGGSYTPLRAIRSVHTRDGQTLKRYPLNSEQRLPRQQVYLLNYALQAVMHEGTGKGAYRYLPSNLALAGKTGTTNDQRDSWFVGFSGSHLATVWVGRDDNGKTPLTGSSGALPTWAQLMQRIETDSLVVPAPDGISYDWIDASSGRLTGEFCENARWVPFIDDQKPTLTERCRPTLKPLKDWFRRLIGYD